MRIGLVPVGYADGYLRAFSNRAMMLLDNTTCPVIGQSAWIDDDRSDRRAQRDNRR